MATWYQYERFKDEERWYVGQVTLQNDCVYRHRHTYKYLAFFDIDEFLIINELPIQPGQIYSEIQLATFLHKLFPPHFASVGIFRWAYTDCRSDKDKGELEEGPVKTLNLEYFTHREKDAEPNEVAPDTADKLIIRPNLVRLFYLHILQEAVPNAKADMMNTPPSVAYIKHLRRYTSSHECQDLTTDFPPDNPHSLWSREFVWCYEWSFWATLICWNACQASLSVILVLTW